MSVRFTLDGETFELTAESVRDRLRGHVAESIQSYWVEVDGVRWPVKQVISLATGVADRQRFQSQSARRWLQRLGFTIGRRQTVEATARSAVVGEPAAVDMPTPKADVVLVGCVKTKLVHGARAKDLYVSDYFTKMRSYAEAIGQPWFILSAEHGLVVPDEWLEPYERYLPDTTREYRHDWGRRVAAQLEQAVGPLAGLVIEIHAGAAYVNAVREALQATGGIVTDQLEGLSFGRRLAWYLERQDVGEPSVVIARLRDQESAMGLRDFLATGGEGLRSPGMYSWWVDETGAEDLSRGSGHSVWPGLVYAGLAGATRSGGSRSSNTLWGRIATMHLGKRHGFSTLRYSLGVILAAANGKPVIDETQLTLWMHAHLRVVLVPVANADTLDALETVVLSELDPRLNLAKVAKTPLRARISTLRKLYAVAPSDVASSEAP